jgi:cholesterol transport system auxiliary component
MKKRAAKTRNTLAKSAFCLVFVGLLAACAGPRGITTAVYDFGPGTVEPRPQNRMALQPLLVMGEVQAPVALEGPALLYRLNYTDAHVLRPYAQARWSMPPGLLLRQQLRSTLSAKRPLLNANEGVPSPAGALVLRMELDEFSHWFDSPQSSRGVLRMRASLLQAGPGGESLVAQRTLVASSAAPTPDAAGGVRALTLAAQDAVTQLDEWVEQTQAALATRP